MPKQFYLTTPSYYPNAQATAAEGLSSGSATRPGEPLFPGIESE